MNTKLVLIGLFLFTFLIFNTSNLFAQKVEWIYEVKDKVETVPQIFWVDKEGNGFYGIRKIDPVNRGRAGYGYYLVMLDKNGKYQRTTVIKNCKRSLRILPFGKDQLISTGFNCDSIRTNRVFDFGGNTLKTGETFPGACFANVWTNDQFTFFSKPLDNFKNSFMTIGEIKKDLSISYDSIPLQKIAKDDLGIVFNKNNPVLLKDNTWVLPMSYGSYENNGIKIEQGIVFGVNNSAISWTYPDPSQTYKLHGVSSYQNKVGVFLDSKKREEPDVFVFLDKNGKEKTKFEITNIRRGVRSVGMTKDKVIILTTNTVYWYDLHGNSLATLDLGESGISRCMNMQLLEDGTLIITGKRNGNAVIIKVEATSETESIEEEIPQEVLTESLEEIEAIPQETLAEKEYEVEFSTIDEVSDEAIISASVYPNPTSAFINFEINSNEEMDNNYVIEIFDARGRLLKTMDTQNGLEPVDVQDFPAGTFIYRIRTQKGKLISGQFIKISR